MEVTMDMIIFAVIITIVIIAVFCVGVHLGLKLNKIIQIKPKPNKVDFDKEIKKQTEDLASYINALMGFGEEVTIKHDN